jgi:hypothetical protein
MENKLDLVNFKTEGFGPSYGDAAFHGNYNTEITYPEIDEEGNVAIVSTVKRLYNCPITLSCIDKIDKDPQSVRTLPRAFYLAMINIISSKSSYAAEHKLENLYYSSCYVSLKFNFNSLCSGDKLAIINTPYKFNDGPVFEVAKERLLQDQLEFEKGIKKINRTLSYITEKFKEIQNEASKN